MITGMITVIQTVSLLICVGLVAYLHRHTALAKIKALEREREEVKREAHGLALELGRARKSGYRPGHWTINLIEVAQRAERRRQIAERRRQIAVALTDATLPRSVAQRWSPPEAAKP
jgi:hypothetical protein